MESKKSVTSPRMLAYVKFQQVELKPPTGSPWRVQMTGHQYEALHSLLLREKALQELMDHRELQ